MLWHFYMVDDELGSRVGEGLGIGLEEVKDLGPLQTQTLTEAEVSRLKNLGKNGPRNVEGITMTHCVPNEHVIVAP
jgi:catalase